MTKAIIFLLAILISIGVTGQNFEGQISYKNVYKSKIPGVSDEQFTSMMGSNLEYFIKDGDYKSIADGTLFQWQLYVNNDNKLYTKMSNTEAVIWNDGAVNADEVIKSEINKNVTEIAGYICDELILTCKSGIQVYYFNSTLSVNAKLFVDHKLGNWYEFLSLSNSLPLRIVIDNEQFYLESTAIAIKNEKLDKSFFDLPPAAQIIKSPY